jgi:protein SCO1/2
MPPRRAPQRSQPGETVPLPGTTLDADSPEAQVAAYVDAVKLAPNRRGQLVALLPEQHPIYSGRSTNATVRMRGYILAAFEQVGLPPAGLPYVLDELQNGRDAYLVAAAARALRGADRPTAQLAPDLVTGIANVRYHDDALSFDAYRPVWPLERYTTAVDEILATLGWLGVHARSTLPELDALAAAPEALSASSQAALADVIARLRALADAADAAAPADACCTPAATTPASDCCASAPIVAAGACCSTSPPADCSANEGHKSSAPPIGACCHGEMNGAEPDAATTALASGQRPTPYAVELEDQDGRRLTFGECFVGAPTVAVFFYTRCTNPNKCSLTIAKLAQLQAAIQAAGLDGQIKMAAISYDPAFDLPARLRSYGEQRGVHFDDHTRLLRTVSTFAPLQHYFELGVNYGTGLVNRHRIELFILDRNGRIVDAVTRLQWDVDDVLGRARAVLERRPGDHAG